MKKKKFSDKTIKLWKNGKCTQTLEGHKEAVTCLATTSENIVSGSMDTTVKIWSIKTSKIVNSLRAHNGGVTCVGIDNGKIFSGCKKYFILFIFVMLFYFILFYFIFLFSFYFILCLKTK